MRIPKSLPALPILLLLLAQTGSQAPAAAAEQEGPPEARLLRFPDIHGETIVFVYGGDLWSVPISGGVARHLTSGAGLELFPKFSPDGRWIAFTGQYSGSNQIYVMPAAGGTPRQLTFHNDAGAAPPRAGYDNEVLGWTPDGKDVVFRTARVPWSNRLGRPYLVPAAGGMERPMRVPESGTGTLSPDGTRFAYTPTYTEFRGWKRYHGGQAQDIWVYDLKKDIAERLTDYPGTDDQPMWMGEKLYFTSDRDGKLNLYSLDLRSHEVRQQTHHDVYDVLWPSAGTGRIVYENGGSIYLFDPAAGSSRRVPIHIEADLPQTLPSFRNVRENITDGEISPTGKRAVLEARGDLFTVPAAKGEIVNLTETPGIREMSPTWSPDGTSIAYLSDRSGEYELYVRNADGTGQERRVTTDGDIWRFPPVWSPDGKKLAFGDKKERLRIADVASGKVTDADTSTRGDITRYSWSPDSRFIAYVKTGENTLNEIWIYALDSSKAARLSDPFYAEYDPVFSPDGNYLYFLSDRDFNLTFSGFESDYIYTDPTRVYVAVLAKSGPPLFLPEDDEETARPETRAAEPAPEGHGEAGKAASPSAGGAGSAAGEGGAESDGGAAKAKGRQGAKPPHVTIDFEGFEQRVRAIPEPPANYSNLSANASGVFYLIRPQGPMGPGGRGRLHHYDIKERKDAVVIEGIQAYRLSQDGKKILFKAGEEYGIADARPGQKASEGLLALDRLEMRVEPREEWRQMFTDAWRIERDWFYDPHMHGLDWPAMRDRYGALLPFLANREDLDFLLSELGAELSAGHVYVERASDAGIKRVEGGLLGAEVEAGPEGTFRIAKIFPGENWQAAGRSPLTEPGVHAEPGELILAVDGRSTRGVDNFYRLLENKADHVVNLTLAHTPGGAGAHTEKVRPVRSEQRLRYLDWVKATRERVTRASGGRIGYIHLPDTAFEGNRELFKGFYAQAGKDALILDDRYNGGGFVPDKMIALLNRPLLNYWVNRGSKELGTTPGFVNTGPKVCLTNGLAGSGGDAFPYYFRKEKIGPLIGTRTWGGLIGLSGNPALIDGGTLSTPATRFLDTDGRWVVEGTGVAPDIEVIDRPDEIAKGHDPSLERAIAYLMEQLEKNPPRHIVAPPPPRQTPSPGAP